MDQERGNGKFVDHAARKYKNIVMRQNINLNAPTVRKIDRDINENSRELKMAFFI